MNLDWKGKFAVSLVGVTLVFSLRLDLELSILRSPCYASIPSFTERGA